MAQPLVGDISFLILYTPDIPAARAFYADLLGMTVETESPGFLQLRAPSGGGVALGIQAGEVKPSGPELWWEAEDIDALRATLAERGVRIVEEPQDKPFGRTLAFADPAGNTLYAFRPRR